MNSIEIKSDSIFNSECKYLVNPVNCVGVMGAGLALQFKERFGNKYFYSYQLDCESGRLKIGTVSFYKISISNQDSKIIINFPTKTHWKDNSNIEDIRKGLNYIKSLNRNFEEGIAFPLLGAGLGGLDKNEVLNLLKEELKDVDWNIEIYV